MPEYVYTALDRSGQTVEGTVQADNSALAAGKVQALGLQLQRVRVAGGPGAAGPGAERRGGPPSERPALAQGQPAGVGQRFAENFVYPVSSGVPLKDLAQFYRQLASMIGAGIPLYQSLVTLESQTRNAKLQGILRDCQKQVQSGGKLSDVFEHYNWVFGEMQVEMIRAAEYGGMLENMLTRIADYLEQEIALRRMISGLTLYPKIVLAAALMLLGKSFFADGMPAFSKLVLGQMGKSNYEIIDYLNDTVFFLAIVLLVIFGIVAFCRVVLFQSQAAQEAYERFKMGIPGLGQVVRKFGLAKFGRAFGAMYAAGMPLNTAIRVAGNASGSKVVASATRRAIAATERGMVLSQAFRETGEFPPIVLDMLHTGEQTGNVDQMMEKVAEYLEGDAQSKAHMYSHIFAAAIGLIVAILIGIAVIRFYSGIGGQMQNYVNDAAGSGP